MAKHTSSRRIHFIDEVRGFDLILMVFFHAFYTMGWLLEWPIGKTLYFFFEPAQPFFAGLFIFICGLCCHFSHNNWLRGGVLALVAVGMSAFLYFFMPDQMIWFGILHLLAVCILLYALLRPLLDRIPPWLGILLAATLVILTWHLPKYTSVTHTYFGVEGIWSIAVPESLTSNPWLHPLGLGYIRSADYFPLLPWFFVFLAGSFVGIWATRGKFPKWTYRSHVPFLSTIGRHTLIIYVLHQPVIYGIGMAIIQVQRWLGFA